MVISLVILFYQQLIMLLHGKIMSIQLETILASQAFSTFSSKQQQQL